VRSAVSVARQGLKKSFYKSRRKTVILRHSEIEAARERVAYDQKGKGRRGALVPMLV